MRYIRFRVTLTEALIAGEGFEEARYVGVHSMDDAWPEQDNTHVDRITQRRQVGFKGTVQDHLCESPPTCRSHAFDWVVR